MMAKARGKKKPAKQRRTTGDLDEREVERVHGGVGTTWDPKQTKEIVGTT
jgi:hypothetical protein